jgi:NADPH:quinone reductase-like Zn-dependent oxidoreductase
MMTDTKYGCYQEYSVSPAHTAWHLAESTSFEEAATLPLAVMTAAIGLYVRLGLAPPPTSGERGSASGIVLINGAASSVGAFAVQLAKRSGYSVVGIAGQSGDYARSLGADEVVDYRSADTGKLVLAAIEKLGGKSKLVGTYDAVSTEKTVELLAYEVLQPEGGKITTVLPAYEGGKGLKVDTVAVDRTMVGTAHSEDAQFATTWYRQIGKWLDDGSFKANQVKLMPNGLDSVKEGVHLLKDGKVNAVKLVYRIADSTCLKQ